MVVYSAKFLPHISGCEVPLNELFRKVVLCEKGSGLSGGLNNNMNLDMHFLLAS